MKDNKPLILLLILLAGGLVYGFMVYGTTLTIPGASVEGTSSNSVETPYGESLEISLGSSSETSGLASFFETKAPVAASWVASYQDSDSQDVYEVNGTYKSQEQVTMEYSLSVSYSNVESISATVKVKAYEEGNKAINNHEYTLANSKALSGVSPIADSDSTVPSILQHLTDVGGSTTSEVVGYEIYCEVTATGTKSGDTLTATIPYTHFGGFSFVKSSESSTAQVTPTISAASFIEPYDPWTLSYYDDMAGLQEGTVMMYMGVSIAAIVGLFIIWSERMRL
jgi:hypothetical protein